MVEVINYENGIDDASIGSSGPVHQTTKVPANRSSFAREIVRDGPNWLITTDSSTDPSLKRPNSKTFANVVLFVRSHVANGLAR